MIRLQIPGDEVFHLTFAATGELYAAADGGHHLRVWVPGGSEPGPTGIGFSRGGRIHALTAARERPWLAVWRGGVIVVFDGAVKRVMRTIPAPTQGRSRLAITPDGSRLVAVPNLRNLRADIRHWQLPVGGEGTRLGPVGGWVTALAIDPTGHWVVTGGRDRQVRIWDLAANQEKSSGGSFLGGLFWEITRQLGLTSPRGQAEDVANRTGIRSLDYDPEGSRLAAATGWTATLRRTDDGKPVAGSAARDLRGHRRLVESVAFSPDGRTLATGCRDGSVKLWEMPGGRELASFEWDIGRVYRVAFSADGFRLAAGGDGGRIVVWDAE